MGASSRSSAVVIGGADAGLPGHVHDLGVTEIGECTYLDGWSSYGATFGPLQMELSMDGLVTVVGIFKHAGKVVTAGTTANQVGTIPDGFRPASSFLCAGMVGAGGINAAVRWDITAGGVMSFQSTASLTATYCSLAGNSWKAA